MENKEHDKSALEVTPSMVDAGMEEFRKHHYDGDVRYMLESVFRELHSASFTASSSRADK